MRASLKSFFGFLIASTLCQVTYAQVDTETTDPSGFLKSDLTKSFAILSKLKSYSYSGSLRLDASDDLLDYLKLKDFEREKAKLAVYNIKVTASGDRMVSEQNRLGNEGRTIETRTFYVDSGQVIVKQLSNESTAQISPINKDSSNLPQYWDPLFLDYGFLNIPTRGEKGGGSAITPSILSDRSVWEKVYAALKSVTPGPNNQLIADFEYDGHRMSVQFVKANNTKMYVPIKLRDYYNNGQLRSDLTLSEFSDAQDIVIAPKKIKMVTYTCLPDGRSLYMGSWMFTIDSVVINPQIDENDLSFDPASVDRIWDNANKVNIVVPH